MRLIIVITLFLMSFSSLASNLKVTFIVPDREGPIFWQLVSEVSKSAAINLHIDFKVIHSDSNRFALKKVINEITHSQYKPDYLIFRPFYGNTKAVFEQLEQAKINFITLEQAFTGERAKALGNPRKKYKYWLGQINYDNKSGGELLFKALEVAHFKKDPNKAMYVTGIGGDFDQVSKDRQRVLEEILATNKDPKVVINQIFHLYWDPNLIQQRFSQMEQRYPNTNVYWCAGDQMALEILKKYQEKHSEPIIIGGFDWLPTTLRKIKKQEITASVGGHFLMVAAALIKVVDYENGFDYFLKPPLLNKYELITHDNIEQHISFFTQKQWTKIDFSKYLHYKNKGNIPTFNVKNLIAEFHAEKN